MKPRKSINSKPWYEKAIEKMLHAHGVFPDDPEVQKSLSGIFETIKKNDPHANAMIHLLDQLERRLQQGVNKKDAPDVVLACALVGLKVSDDLATHNRDILSQLPSDHKLYVPRHGYATREGHWDSETEEMETRIVRTDPDERDRVRKAAQLEITHLEKLGHRIAITGDNDREKNEAVTRLTKVFSYIDQKDIPAIEKVLLVNPKDAGAVENAKQGKPREYRLDVVDIQKAIFNNFDPATRPKRPGLKTEDDLHQIPSKKRADTLKLFNKHKELTQQKSQSKTTDDFYKINGPKKKA